MTLVQDFLNAKIPASALGEPAWGPNGVTVYERTYSRPLFTADGARQPWTLGDTEGRTREVWAETCRRVVLGNTSLSPDTLWDGEVEELFTEMFNFGIIPAGRHLWVDGTGLPYTRNCWSCPTGEVTSEHFRFIASRLFEGGGVGGNYSSDLTEQTTPVQGRVFVSITARADHPDITDIMAMANGAWVDHAEDVYRVPDTREGWVEAWGDLVDAACSPGDKKFVFDVSDVRPFGAELKTYGGTASGPAPLVKSLVKFGEVLTRAYGRHLSPMDFMDMDHEIADSVVAGGARRSSRLSTIHWRDPWVFEFINSKKDMSSHWSTNISVEIDDDFEAAIGNDDPHAHAVLDAVVSGMIHNDGEPGFINTSRLSEYENSYIRTTNPCVTGDTWVSTTEGLQQVNDLLGRKFTARISGEWDSTDDGFFLTGHKPIIGLHVEGSVLKLTHNHKVMTPEGWVEAGELAVGDMVTLDENKVGRIAAITDEGTADVYDVQIPGINAFVANGIVVHNCGEIGLETEGSSYGEACNIGSVNLAQVGSDTKRGQHLFELLARFLYRSTLLPHHSRGASAIESRNRRLGAGFMGLQEWVLSHGIRLSEAPDHAGLTQALTSFREATRRAADDLADELGLPRSIKVTCVAPNGSISKLPGVAPGIHPVLARYAELRMRFGAADPKVDQMRAKGYDVEPCVYSANTMVVTIPTRDIIMDRGLDPSLIEQADELPVDKFLGIQRWVTHNFTGGADGNAVSATASIDPTISHEDLKSSLLDFIFELKGTTVFPNVSRPQSPVTPISEERYLELVQQSEANSGSLFDDCASGACPIR